MQLLILFFKSCIYNLNSRFIKLYYKTPRALVSREEYKGSCVKKRGYFFFIRKNIIPLQLFSDFKSVEVHAL